MVLNVALTILMLTAHHMSCAFVMILNHQTQQHKSSARHTSSLSITLDEGSIIWQMHRDESDEWLDQVLIQRFNSSSIFSLSSLVVESFMTKNSGNDSRPLLRRMSCCEDDSSDNTTPQEFLFSQLFGTWNEKSEVTTDLVSSAKSTRTSKKNRKRTNLKITVAYRGRDFCGWEDQRHELYRNSNKSIKSSNSTTQQLLPSVQGTLADILGPLIGNGKSKPVEIKVAGRTDRGVSAIGQVCRVRTWKEIPDIESYIQESVNKRATGLQVTSVEQVGPDFHPSFGATCRSYVYLLNFEENDDDDNPNGGKERPRISRNIVPILDRMLRELEGKELDYFALSHGKVVTETTLCRLYRSRASIVELTGDNDCYGIASYKHKQQALCFELVGNRFLRRMVRLIVGTALREAHRGGHDGDDALLKILLTKDRRMRSRAAPPDGLIFVGAEFET